jgi:guanylate kinase
VIIIHTVYCVLGRTSSGKSTITQKAANNLNMKVLKSYTTRQRRENETDESCDHIFISSNEVEKYRNDMIAYTDRVGYCSFATKQQLLDNDFYIINPTGYYELKLKTKDMDIELVTIMVNVPYNDLRQRAKKRGDYDAWQANYIKESEEFSSFEKSHLIDYFVLNDRSIEESVAKMVRVINKDRAKRGITNEK